RRAGAQHQPVATHPRPAGVLPTGPGQTAADRVLQRRRPPGPPRPTVAPTLRRGLPPPEGLHCRAGTTTGPTLIRLRVINGPQSQPSSTPSTTIPDLGMPETARNDLGSGPEARNRIQLPASSTPNGDEPRLQATG